MATSAYERVQAALRQHVAKCPHCRIDAERRVVIWVCDTAAVLLERLHTYRWKRGPGDSTHLLPDWDALGPLLGYRHSFLWLDEHDIPGPVVQVGPG